MKHVICLFLLFLFLAPAAWGEESPAAAGIKSDLTAKVDEIFAEVTYRVILEDGKLVLRIPLGSFPLAPSYADAFQSPPGLVRFYRDGVGRVTHLGIGMGRVRDLRFARIAK